MRLIAIDTSGTAARWVGVENSLMVDPVEVLAGRRHDAVLAAGVYDWLERNKWDSLDGIAVVIGPGGYTGLRVGVAFALAFATGRGIPVLPVSTYQVTAARVPGLNREELPGATAKGEIEILVILPYRKGTCRGRLMSGGDLPVPRGEAVDFPVDGGEPPGGGACLPLGEGYERYRDEIDVLLGTRRTKAAIGLRTECEALAAVTRELWRTGHHLDPLEVDIDYGAVFQPTPKKKAR